MRAAPLNSTALCKRTNLQIWISQNDHFASCQYERGHSNEDNTLESGLKVALKERCDETKSPSEDVESRGELIGCTRNCGGH